MKKPNPHRLIEKIGRHLLLLLVGVPLSVSAVTLSLSGDQLIGAQGIDISGVLYNVEFLDGTCIGLYSGCDNVGSDFLFQTEEAARSASQALLDQVFLNVYDTDQSLTRGCTTAAECRPLTPYALLTFGNAPGVLVANAVNLASADGDYVIAGGGFLVTTDTALAPNSTSNQSWTFAVWSLPTANVPEPGTLALLGLGLFGVAAMRRRRASL